MSSFGQDFLKGFTATQSLRDYTHASKTFRTNAYELKPRFKFLFHVKFNINVDLLKQFQNAQIFQAENINNLSLAVKTVDLPKYKIDTQTLNQYNRKRIIQTKINYDPINVTFHDDGGDNIRSLWYYYYNYYYKDSSYKFDPSAPTTNGSIGNSQTNQTGFNYADRDIYEQNRSGQVSDWGFIGETYLDGGSTARGKPAFFDSIDIYGFDQHKFARYVLVNPLITAWNHDNYDYSQGNGVMQHTMTVAFETVKYYNGALGAPGVKVPWPDTAHYDTEKSPLARAGSTTSVFGQGGLIDTAGGIMEDLQKGGVAGLLGAAQKAGATYNTFKGKNLKAVVQSEAISLGKDVIRTSGPNATRQAINKVDGWVFPTAKR
jgi:hypothetical protein